MCVFCRMGGGVYTGNKGINYSYTVGNPRHRLSGKIFYTPVLSFCIWGLTNWSFFPSGFEKEEEVRRYSDDFILLMIIYFNYKYFDSKII